MFAARSVPFFPTDIPFGHLLRLHVVIYGMAAVARGSGGTIEVGRPVKRNPPVRSRFHVIGQPLLFRDVPLRRQRIIIVATLGEIALLIATSVDERDLIQIKSA